MRKALTCSLVFLPALFCFLNVSAQQPTSISGLQLWLDASDVAATGSNPAAGTALTTWKDKSGAGHDALTLAGQAAAVLVSNEINGKPVMRFTRSSLTQGNVYQVAGVDIRAASMNAVTIFTVYKQGTRSGDQGIWGDDNGEWDRFYFSSWSGYAGADNGGASLGPTNPAAIVYGAGIPNVTRLLTAVYDHGVNNGSAIYFNGQVVTRFTDNTSPTNAQSSFYIGFDGDDNTFNGDVADLLVYNRKLTDCEIQQVNQYLSQKYGAVFSTVATTATGATTFKKGGSVLLNTTASGTLQWLRDDKEISGATASQYRADTTGNYRVVVYNGACRDTSAAIKVTVYAPVAVTTTTALKCNGNQNGVIKAIFADRSAGDVIAWYKNSSRITANITTSVSGDSIISQATGLGAGTYRVAVTNSNNALLTDTTFTLTEPAALKVSGVVTAATCYNRCDGIINSSATGGTGAYLFSCGSSVPSSATAYTALCAAAYTLRVSDANGCTDSAIVTVTQPAAATLALTAHTDTLLCKGTKLIVNAARAGNNTYAWSGDNGYTSAGSQVTLTEAGLYKITVTEADGCTYKDSIRLAYTADTAIRARVVLATHAWVNETVTAQNATIATPQSQAWLVPNGAQVVSMADSKLIMKFAAAGQYEVKLTNSSYNVCTSRDSATIFIDQAPKPVVTVQTPVICNNDKTGVLQTYFIAKAGNYTIQWFRNNQAVTTNISTWVAADTLYSRISGQDAADYRAEVTDASGGVIAAAVYTLQNPAVLEVSGQASATTCFNRCDGQAILTASGGVAPYLYQVGSAPAVSTTMFPQLCAAAYTIQVTDANGCSSTGAVTVAQAPVTGLSLTAATDTLLCKGATLAVNAQVAGNATYVWTGVNGFTSDKSNIQVQAAGLYRVTVKQQDGCTYSDSVRLAYTAEAAIPAKMMLTSHASLNEEVVAVNLTSPAPQSQVWTIPSGATVVSRTDEKMILKFAAKGTYEVKLAAASYNVCGSRDSASVVIDDPATVNNADKQIIVREVSAAPNPTSGAFNLYIKLNKEGKVAVRIYSFTGVLAYNAEIPAGSGTNIIYPVNLSGQVKGTYIVVVETANSSEVRKVLIN